jgi:hypothetical protein
LKLHGWAGNEHVIITTSTTKELWFINVVNGHKDVIMNNIDTVYLLTQPRLYFDNIHADTTTTTTSNTAATATSSTSSTTLSLLGDNSDNERIIIEGNDDRRVSCYLMKSLLESKKDNDALTSCQPEWILSSVTHHIDWESTTLVPPHYLVTYEPSLHIFMTYNLLTGHLIHQWSYEAHVDEPLVSLKANNIEIDEVYATSEWILISIGNCLPDPLIVIIDSYIF